MEDDLEDDLEDDSKQEQQSTGDEEEEEESLTDDEEEEEEEEADVEDSEAAEAEGRPSWAMLSKLKLHELRAVAEEFLKDADRDKTPKRKQELASYLVTVGTATLPEFEAFISSYRDAYVKKRRNSPSWCYRLRQSRNASCSNSQTPPLRSRSNANKSFMTPH